MYPLISVIVPVYNVEDYLRKCLDSIVNQTYKNLEIILIDDGSTDNSGKICDEYAAKDNRIKLIHKPNGGLSDARNAGLEIAKGEYIGFVDSDDYIAEDMYEFLYNFAAENNLDVAMCTACNVYDNGKIEHPRDFETILLSKKDEIIENLFINKCGGSAVNVWSKLFKKEVLNNCKFAIGKTSEDAFIILNWIDNTTRFGRSSEVKYYYVQRKHSITHRFLYSPKILDVVDAYALNLKIISQKYPKCKDIAKVRFFWALRTAVEQIYICEDCKNHNHIIKKMQNILRKNLIDILTSNYITLKGKIRYIIIALNLKFYFKIKNNSNYILK